MADMTLAEALAVQCMFDQYIRNNCNVSPGERAAASEAYNLIVNTANLIFKSFEQVEKE